MAHRPVQSGNLRAIDRRAMPAVAGIDLEQAVNYLDWGEAGEDFIYNRYTSSRLLHRRGMRRRLESVASQAVRGAARSPMGEVRALAAWGAQHVRWAGFYEKEKGRRLAADRNLSEESLIDSGYGWCNEQARVFCALVQVRGYCSRLVFASNPLLGHGHVIAEVLLPAGWMAVDQSFGFCFSRRGVPVRASAIYHDRASRAFFSARYAALCRRLQRDLGDIVARDFKMAVADEPLAGFSALGFHNHYLRPISR